METEFEETNKILKENKKLIIEQIKITTSFEEKEKLFKILSRIDEDIFKNLKRIEELNAAKNINKLENTISLKSNVKNKKDNISFKLNETEIKEILENKNFIPIKHINEKNNVKTTYVYKSISKNYIYYICNNRKSCKGSGKININNNEFIITKTCDENAVHNKIDYDEFCQILKDKDYNKLDFKDKEIQKFYVYYIISENNNIDNPSIKKYYYNLTKVSLSLNLVELSRIRNKITDKYKNLALEEIIDRLKLDNLDIYTNILDLNYEYKNKNKTEKREHRIIIFGLKENIKYFKNSFTKEFFFRFYI